MSNRGKHISNAVICKCNKCGTEAVGVVGKPHRNCSGKEGSMPRKRTQRIPGSKRGLWEAA